MIIRIASSGSVSIEEPANFRKFKVACDVPEARLADIKIRNPRGVSFDDARTAWVSIAALKGWDGLKDDKAWQEGLAAMIKAAAPHGWISEEKQAIKAHVEWAAS
jgi:hypothetical protein